MSAKTVGLKVTITRLLVWLVFFPFLAIWPFLSAFPLFSLMNSSGLDLWSALDFIFFLTGFWPFAALILAAFALMYEETRQATYKTFRGLGPWIGGYAILWTALYLVAAVSQL